jgi:hypothetical protein
MATTTKKEENKQVTAQEQQEPIADPMQIGQVGMVEVDD